MNLYNKPYLNTSHSTSFISSQCNTNATQPTSPRFFRKQNINNRETRRQKDIDETIFKFLSPKSQTHEFYQVQEPINKYQDSKIINRAQRKTFDFSEHKNVRKNTQIAFITESSSKTSNTFSVQTRIQTLQEELSRAKIQIQNLQEENFEKTNELKEYRIKYQSLIHLTQKIKQVQNKNIILESKINNLQQLIFEKDHNLNKLQSKYKSIYENQLKSATQKLIEIQSIISLLQNKNKQITKEMKNKTQLLKHQSIEVIMLKRKLQDAKILSKNYKKSTQQKKQLNNLLIVYKEKLTMIKGLHKKLENKRMLQCKKNAEDLFILSSDQEESQLEQTRTRSSTKRK